MTDVPPMVKWTAAVIAGGGVAGLTQGATAMLRAKSTGLTGGIGNWVIATAVLGGALLVTLLAMAAPLAALGLVIVTAQVVLMGQERRRDIAKFEGSRVRASMMFQPCFLAVEKKDG